MIQKQGGLGVRNILVNQLHLHPSPLASVTDANFSTGVCPVLGLIITRVMASWWGNSWESHAYSLGLDFFDDDKVVLSKNVIDDLRLQINCDWVVKL